MLFNKREKRAKSKVYFHNLVLDFCDVPGSNYFL